jgi:hypothetical protein
VRQPLTCPAEAVSIGEVAWLKPVSPSNVSLDIHQLIVPMTTFRQQKIFSLQLKKVEASDVTVFGFVQSHHLAFLSTSIDLSSGRPVSSPQKKMFPLD